ncbi:hypothetical protein LTR62_007050 [Meristemomyces frigidus]|uniref:Uncharacterized protein n=1 Tax=Meristemomyces frigidus TaxID=1508187 RepID=A0AAN7TCN2_9PEZI|nr:hypothetical protein LTR62_007050 [Meristemomyces frigidus]
MAETACMPLPDEEDEDDLHASFAGSAFGNVAQPAFGQQAARSPAVRTGNGLFGGTAAGGGLSGKVAPASSFGHQNSQGPVPALGQKSTQFPAARGADGLFGSIWTGGGMFGNVPPPSPSALHGS